MQIQVNTNNQVKHHIAFLNEEKQLLVSQKWQEDNPYLFTCAASYIKLTPLPDDTIHTFHGNEGQTLYVISLTKTSPSFLALGSRIGKLLLKESITDVSLCLPATTDNVIVVNIEAIIEGILLGNYYYDTFQSKPKYKKIESLFLYSELTTEHFTEPLKQAQIHANAVYLARNLGNTPANLLTPSLFHKQAKEIAKNQQLNFFSLSLDQIKKEGLNLLHAVGKGSVEDPVVVGLRYSYKKDAPTLLLVGKGVTFDSGGISLKPAAKMHEMKTDMCGAAAVLGAMQIISEKKPKINIIALIGLAENLPSGSATKPGDVVTSYDGKTVEILNTDAEGRLILADCISYGIATFQPDAIIDIATLTGACIIALGKEHTGAMTNDQHLYEQLEKIGTNLEEPIWQLPLSKRYRDAVKGTVGDLKNMGTPAEGSSICGATFLEAFVKDTPWVHLDIAGTSAEVPDKDIYPSNGATGVGVKMLAQFAQSWNK